MTRTLCIDLGGTNIRAGLLAGDAAAPSPLGSWPAPSRLDALQQRIATLVEAQSADNMGIAVPGRASGTRCNWIPNLPISTASTWRCSFRAFPSRSAMTRNSRCWPRQRRVRRAS
jgi:glucokinase